jgi:hypothetical protein
VIRLLFLAVAVSLACKLILGRWPWDYLRLRATRAQAAVRARKLLGLRADATREEILEAHKRLLAIVHPDKGGANSLVHEANAARDLLLEQLRDGN